MSARRPARNGSRLRATLAARALLVALTAGLALFAACGPSVQSIYEGNVRFEHCYRLDLDVDIAPTHRAACWSEWLKTYTYGQSRDRIDYARRRMHAFASGDTAQLTLDVSQSHRTEARQFYLVVPAPTSVHAPPAPVATRWYGDAGPPPDGSATTGNASTADASAPDPAPTRASGKPGAPDAAAGDVPGEACQSACVKGLEACRSRCNAAPAVPRSGCASCDPDYRACMRRCFQ